MYNERNDEENNNKDFIETVVNKGNKLKVDFEIGEDKSDKVLSWEFRTIDYDIKFGIISEDNKTGEKRSEVPLGTVYSNEMDEIGFISTRPNTKCKYQCMTYLGMTFSTFDFCNIFWTFSTFFNFLYNLHHLFIIII